jgi:hypothetical protein
MTKILGASSTTRGTHVVGAARDLVKADAATAQVRHSGREARNSPESLFEFCK